MFFKTVALELENDIKKMKKYYFLEEKYKKYKILNKIFSRLKYIQHKKIFLKYSCDITPTAQLNEVIFRHPLGIVIGGGAILKTGVIIHQNVTLGALRFDLIEKRGIFCNQIISEGTIICAGAKILGDVVIGRNCIIGANAVVTKDVPNDSVVVGYNKILKR